jgi:transcriptional regulator with XRE-family HTH domain
MPINAARVGQNVREQREKAGLSLSQLAAITGISKAHLVRLETKPSNPSLGILSRIADALDLTVADLVGGPKLTYQPEAGGSTPPSLERFADEMKLNSNERRTLRSIRFRDGEAPRTVERWRYIYESLRLSEHLDHRDDNADLD